MSSIKEPQAALLDYAIIVDPNDNVAVVKRATTSDLEVVLPDGKVVQLRNEVLPGHRFATREIEAGQFVLQFGQPIGTSLGIKAGELISHANMTDDVPIVRDLPEDLHTPAPSYLPESERARFTGYRRKE